LWLGIIEIDELIKKKCIIIYYVTLFSGGKSSYYYDLKAIALNPKALLPDWRVTVRRAVKQNKDKRSKSN
jgi:orotate phosphoribosyltransferase